MPTLRSVLAGVAAVLLAALGTASVTSAQQLASRGAAAELAGGRGTLLVCVAIDQSSFSAPQAKTIVEDVIRNDLNSHPGWYAITQRPSVQSGCPFKAIALTAGTSAPQASTGEFRVNRVSTPSPFVLHVYVTSSAEIKRVFGTLPDQRIPEEVTCAAGVCEEVTTSVLVDDTTLRDRTQLRHQLASGLGLTPPTRGIRVVR